MKSEAFPRLDYPSFDDLGFRVALLELMEQYRALKKYDIQEDVVLQEETISEEIKLTAFRIVQEQLNNIVKHAGATKIKVAVVQFPHELRIEVQDNGVGFNPANRRKGIGISNILNRAEVFKGTVIIDTAVNNGCKLTVVLPLDGR